MARASGALRQVYSVNDASGSVPTQLELTTEGQTVVQVLLWAEVDGVAPSATAAWGRNAWV